MVLGAYAGPRECGHLVANRDLVVEAEQEPRSSQLFGGLVHTRGNDAWLSEKQEQVELGQRGQAREQDRQCQAIEKTEPGRYKLDT